MISMLERRCNMNSISLVITLQGNIKCECVCGYDANTGVIHVIDNYKTGNRSVTNAIDEIQQSILDQLGLKGHKDNYTWLLYGTDLRISEYSEERFSFVDESEGIVNEVYAAQMNNRY